MSSPADQTQAETLQGRLSAAAEAAGFRWVSLIPGSAAEAEGLLQLQGLVQEAVSPWRIAADIYVWIEPGEAGPAVCSAGLRPDHAGPPCLS